MADTYHIIDGQVVPYSGGRRCNDTSAWRDATPLELQLQEQLDEYEHIIAAHTAEIERLQGEVDALREALEDIRSRSSMNLAMNSDPFELTARLGDIYQIADAMLKAREASND